MRKYVRKYVRLFFKWIFKEELTLLENARARYEYDFRRYNDETAKIKNLLGNLDISVDYHEYSKSWAVISIQGERTNYIKFIDLPGKEIREIARFLERYDRSKVDCTPALSMLFRI